MKNELIPGSTEEKEFYELKFWKSKKDSEGILSNGHYARFYTTHFGIDPEFYDGKVILDIGCGPRGSLEWANNTKRRIGLDPLANEYLKLGADKHKMEYINSGSENIPLNDGECDVVFSFNSFDHVANIEDTVREIKRIVSPNGLFLLLVDVNHPPTKCEPHDLTPRSILQAFQPEFNFEDLRVYKKSAKGMYASLRLGDQYDDPLNCEERGYISVKFIRS